MKAPDGTSVAGARVWAIAAWDHRFEGSLPEFGRSAKEQADEDAAGKPSGDWIGATCDEDGRFEFSGLRTLRGWQVGAFDASIGAGLSDVYSFDRDHPELTFDVQLFRGVLLHGVVKSEDGTLLGNAQIILRSVWGGTKVVKTTIVSSATHKRLGDFNVGFRCGESLEYECSVPGFLPKPRTRIEIPPKATEVNLEITLQRRTGKVVHGRIVDRGGHPVELLPLLWEKLVATAPGSRAYKVAVRALPDAPTSTASDPVAAANAGSVDGRIDFIHGTYEFVLADDFHGTLELQISKQVVGTAALTDLSRPPDLPCDADRIPKEAAPKAFAVRFVDAGTKEPIPFGQHDPVPPASFGSTLSQLRKESDGEHGLIVYGCEPGVLKIPILIEGYAACLEYVEVPAGEQREPLTLAVPRAEAGVHGFAFRSDGRPLSKATISLFRVTAGGLSDTTSASVATSPEGEFEFDTLAKGEHVIVVSGAPDEAPGVIRFQATRPPPEVEVRSRPGSVTCFRFVPTLVAGQSLDTSLSILDPEGVIVDASISAWKTEKQVFDERSVTLRAGHYTAVATRDGFREKRVEFDVPALDDAVEIALEPLQPRSK